MTETPLVETPEIRTVDNPANPLEEAGHAVEQAIAHQAGVIQELVKSDAEKSQDEILRECHAMITQVHSLAATLAGIAEGITPMVAQFLPKVEQLMKHPMVESLLS